MDKKEKMFGNRNFHARQIVHCATKTPINFNVGSSLIYCYRFRIRGIELLAAIKKETKKREL